MMDNILAKAINKILPNDLGKQIRLVMPKDGVPVFLGKDAVEKFAALNRQKNRGSM